MAEMDSTEKRALSECDVERVKDDLMRAVGVILAAREMASALESSEGVGIQALCEKAGFLVDRCIAAVGGTPFSGSFEEWAGLVRDDESTVTA